MGEFVESGIALADSLVDSGGLILSVGRRDIQCILWPSGSTLWT